MSKVLILTDGKAGHENQSKAFARALGYEFDLVEVHFRSKLAKALSYFLDRVGLRTMRLLSAAVDCNRLQSKPVAVIGTGSGTFYAAKAMARRLGVKCGVVLYPRGYDIASFDCVVAPAFDRPKKAKHVIEIPANLVANDEAFYAKGVEAFWEKRGRDAPAPKENAAQDSGAGYPLAKQPRSGGYGGASRPRVSAIAVIVGGPNKCSTMTPEWMKAQLDAIFAPSAKHQIPDTQYWVTTSRRTPPEVEAVVDGYPWDYKLLYSKDHFNPIPAFVKLAKKLYVTAESTGMLSESCTFGTAEVVALDNLKPGPHKFRRFVEDLRKGGYVDGNRKVDLSEQFARAKALMGL